MGLDAFLVQHVTSNHLLLYGYFEILLSMQEKQYLWVNIVMYLKCWLSICKLLCFCVWCNESYVECGLLTFTWTVSKVTGVDVCVNKVQLLSLRSVFCLFL